MRKSIMYLTWRVGPTSYIHDYRNQHNIEKFLYTDYLEFSYYL